MKKIIILLAALFLLSGCYSSVGVGGGIPIGNSGAVGSTVSVGSDGQVHGSVGIGGWTRI